MAANDSMIIPPPPGTARDELTGNALTNNANTDATDKIAVSLFLEDGNLTFTEELFKTISKCHHKEITHPILETLTRVELICNKMQGITNL